MTHPTLTVFFDGGCPLCSKEIAHYRGLRGAERIQWLDVTDGTLDLSPYGLDRLAVIKEFHVLDADGELHIGADGFLTLWAALPRYRWLYRVVSLLGLAPLLRRAYRRFAAWHFRRRCDQGVCPSA
jgi:predicted DCC family thiol-disulfide oxidoreductase YuxK